jgi:hypothetical protein
MIELENASQAGLRHFVSVEWACTQEMSPAMLAPNSEVKETASRREPRQQAGRLQFERCPGLCDPEAAAANSYWELTVGSSSKEKRTVVRAVSVASLRAGPND